MKDLHITLPDEAAEEIDRLARDLNETRIGLIRRALEQFLAAERKRKLARAMKAYAEEMAAESGEFIKQTDKMVVKKLLKETRW